MAFFIFLIVGGAAIGTTGGLIEWWRDRDDRVLRGLREGMARERLDEIREEDRARGAKEDEVNRLIAARCTHYDKRAREEVR